MRQIAITFALFLAVFILNVSHSAEAAIPFSIENVFGSGELIVDYTTIVESQKNWSFDLSSLTSFGRIDSASLSITHKGNSNNLIEAWKVGGFGHISMLSKSESFELGDYTVTDVFLLPDWVVNQVNADLQSGDFQAEFYLSEMTENFIAEQLAPLENITLYSAKISGNYAPVPEPATIAMFGLGLAGVMMSRKK